MCGRYAMAQSQEEIVAFFNLVENDSNPTLPLNWNVAPTNEIYIVKDRDRESHQRVLDTASWGLIAPWQKNLPMHVPVNRMQSTRGVNRFMRNQLFEMPSEQRVV
jgi:putative SOS response-associated peptidase YedK